MIIPQASVLFIENLRADSEIVAAISRFKSGEVPAATARPDDAGTDRAAFDCGTEPDPLSRLRRFFRRARWWLLANRSRLRNVAIAMIVFFGVVLFTQWWDFTVPSLGKAEYQAVFLANGQTYFGRYYDRIGSYAKIEDVYYLQQTAATNPDQAPDTKLVRRGKELHAPSARMLVPKSAILFVEDLTVASPIAQFMKQDQP